MYYFHRPRLNGFTLIELLVVIVIIGVLATLATVAVNGTRSKARDARRLSDLKQIGTALELYYSDHSAYPSYVTPGQSLISADGFKTYMTKIPNNPGGFTNSQMNSDYSYFSNGSKYTLRTYTESVVSDLPDGGKLVLGGGLKNAESIDNRYWDVDLTFGNILVGHWPLDGLQGTRDLSGNNQTGAITGGVSTTTGKFSETAGAYSFDGAGYVNAPMPNLTAFTVSVWAKPSGDMSSSYGIVEFTDSTTKRRGLSLYYINKAPYIIYGDNKYRLMTAPSKSYNDNQWYHFVATYDGVTPILYINAVSQTLGGESTGSAPNESGIVKIGRIPIAGANYYTGNISDVRIYSRALTPDEITALYTATKP